jgi:hypothetical protein
VKIFRLFLCAIACFNILNGQEEVKFEDYREYFGDHYDIKEDHRRAVIIMNKINQAKNKTDVRILSMLLEIELDYLDQETHKNREYLETKRYLCQIGRFSQEEIKDVAQEIRNTEEAIRLNAEAIKIIDQWREEYLN